jgi:hypothetical protein
MTKGQHTQKEFILTIKAMKNIKQLCFDGIVVKKYFSNLLKSKSKRHINFICKIEHMSSHVGSCIE